MNLPATSNTAQHQISASLQLLETGRSERADKARNINNNEDGVSKEDPAFDLQEALRELNTLLAQMADHDPEWLKTAAGYQLLGELALVLERVEKDVQGVANGNTQADKLIKNNMSFQMLQTLYTSKPGSDHSIFDCVDEYLDNPKKGINELATTFGDLLGSGAIKFLMQDNTNYINNPYQIRNNS